MARVAPFCMVRVEHMRTIVVIKLFALSRQKRELHGQPMVKKADGDWQTFTFASHSATNVRKYLDACQTWLIAPDNTQESTHMQFFNMRSNFAKGAQMTFGMYDTDIKSVQQFKCSVCTRDANMETDGKCMVANPFTRAEFMLLCADCHQEINSFR